MDKNYGYSQNKSNSEDICFANSATTHTILRDRKYFSSLMLTKVKITAISGQSDVIEDSGKTQICYQMEQYCPYKMHCTLLDLLEIC